VPGRSEETAQEESGQQEPLQIWRQGDASESALFFTQLLLSSLFLVD